MKYLKVHWNHGLEDEPVMLYSEIAKAPQFVPSEISREELSRFGRNIFIT